MNIKKIVAPIVGLVVAGLLSACTPAEVASSNISQDSEYQIRLHNPLL